MQLLYRRSIIDLKLECIGLELCAHSSGTGGISHSARSIPLITTPAGGPFDSLAVKEASNLEAGNAALRVTRASKRARRWSHYSRDFAFYRTVNTPRTQLRFFPEFSGRSRGCLRAREQHSKQLE
jgi:hypothetical protein